MLSLIVPVALVVIGLSVFCTGHSPFYWLARLAIIVEASLLCLVRVALQAAVVWWQRLPAHIQEVQREIVMGN